MSALPKVYVFCAQPNVTVMGDIGVLAVSEDGYTLGRHICSSMAFAEFDLTKTPRRKQELEAHYPNGYEVVVLPEGQFPPKDVEQRHKLNNAARKTLQAVVS